MSEIYYVATLQSDTKLFFFPGIGKSHEIPLGIDFIVDNGLHVG